MNRLHQGWALQEKTFRFALDPGAPPSTEFCSVTSASAPLIGPLDRINAGRQRVGSVSGVS